jgi:uncharacterized phage protein (TIGR02220 family)
VKIQPKNWKTFQHYKDRDPTWIKLHKKLLDDFEYQSLPVASRALAPMLWLLATEHPEAVIDADEAKLAFRLRLPVSEVLDALSPLIGKGFFTVVQFDSAPLAEGYPPSTPETYKAEGYKPETETPLVRLAPDAALAKKRKAQVKTEALQFLDFLNAKAGKHFRPVPSNLRFIEARLAEDVSLQDLKTLTVRKCREWLGTDQEKYLRPETLCNATKCHSYLGEIPPEDSCTNALDATAASSSELKTAPVDGRPPITLPRLSAPILAAGVVPGERGLSNATTPARSDTGLRAMGSFIAGITSSAEIRSADSESSKNPETGTPESPFPFGASPLH